MLTELAPFLVLAVVLVLLGLLLRHGMTFKRRMLERARALEAAVEPMGFRSDRADLEGVRAAVLEVPRFSRRRLEIEGMLASQGRDGRRYLLDYLSRGGSSRSTTERGTLFAVDLGSARLPRFTLHGFPGGSRVPELATEGLLRLVRTSYPGFEPVDLAPVFPGPPPCIAFAEDPAAVRALLARAVAALLARDPAWYLESTGRWLFAGRTGRSGRARRDAATTAGDLAAFEELADALRP